MNTLLEWTVAHVTLVAATLATKLKIRPSAAVELTQVEISSGLWSKNTGPGMGAVVVHPTGGVIEGLQVQPGVHVLVLGGWIPVVLEVAACAGTAIIVVEAVGSFADVGYGSSVW